MKKDKKYLYVLQCNEYVKFGISSNPKYRVSSLQTGNPYKINLLLAIIYKDCFEIEKNIHKYYDEKRERGEWFFIDEEIKSFVKYLKNIEYEAKRRGDL